MGKLFDVSLVFSSIPELLTKLPITLELAVVSMLIGLGLGLVMAIIKMKKIRVLTQITNLLISLLRGTPVIVQLYVAFFGIPMMFKAINQQFGTNLAVANISGFVYAMIALGLNQSGLITGKTHQIRASLAHIGCPIIGDDKYGDRVGNRSFPAGLRLTATRIVFPNKLDGLEYLCGKSIEIEPPYNTQLIKNQL